MKYALAILLLLATPVPSSGDDTIVSPDNPGPSPTSRQIEFGRDIYTLLQKACMECHGAVKQEGGLRLDQREMLLDSSAIAPGKPEQSELLRRIALPRGHDELMPAVGEPLSKREIANFREWIAQGADWPQEFAGQTHWAYVVPTRPDLPEVSDLDWIRSPMDHFVLHRLEEEGLVPSPPARTEKLVRRVFLDLLGLPPTPQEVSAYLENPSGHKYEELIDELLQRPQFGERWARPWLDLARYSDSHGFQRDDLRDLWAYRDWVIQALNDDMPFDRFTIEQIAGDLLPDATESQKIATGFHRSAPTNVEAGSLPEETRVEQVLDRVNTTGAVWLGTTLECCQCHDHKFDPFSIGDYYRLLAFFNSTELEADRADEKSPSSIKFQGPSMPLSDPQRDGQRADLQAQLESVKRQLDQQSQELSQHLDAWAPKLANDLAEASQRHALVVSSFESSGTTDQYQNLDDGSLLLVGDDPPDQDEYILRAQTELQDIRAFYLEALQHESLPGGGPGRGDAERRNFVLNEFSVRLVPKLADEPKAESVGADALRFSSASASFSQKNWDVAGAVDKDPKSGWAISPKFDASHWAKFVLSEPLTVPADRELEFKLTQSWGKARTLGCFRLTAVTGNPDAETAPAEIVDIVKQPVEAWSKKQRQALIDYRIKSDPLSQTLERQISKLKKDLEAIAPDTTLVMRELPESRQSVVFERGDYRTPGENVLPGTPEVLHALPEGEANRLLLARWLISTENPLVARVTVNRWWAELFGHGIVATPEDFGIKGDRPTHPELLDWLALELMENGWSMKKLLKRIVMSSTYQQASDVTPSMLDADPDNRLFARGPRIRMDAEMIRDNALAVSGLLNLEQFGVPIRPYQPDGIWRKVGGEVYSYEVSPGGAQYRRGIYVVHKRGSPYPSFSNFDATARLACTVQRSRTNTPLQALTLLNDPVYVAATQALADLVQTQEVRLTFEEQLELAFQRCIARKPAEAEQRALRDLYAEQLKAHTERGTNNPKSAAWYSVAAVLLNLHETITKD